MRSTELKKLIRESIQEVLVEKGLMDKIKGTFKDISAMKSNLIKFPKVGPKMIARYKYAKDMDKLITSKLDKVQQKEMQTLLMRSVMNKLTEAEKDQLRNLWLIIYDNAINPSHIGMVWYPFDMEEIEDDDNDDDDDDDNYDDYEYVDESKRRRRY